MGGTIIQTRMPRNYSKKEVAKNKKRHKEILERKYERFKKQNQESKLNNMTRVKKARHKQEEKLKQRREQSRRRYERMGIRPKSGED